VRESVEHSDTLADLTATFYKAPEVFKGEDPSSKVDMWSLGIILFELTTKTFPMSNVA
jgi:serine/threonine protein kinase